MSENSLQYENLGVVEDYIEKNYKEWQEKYIIPYEDEFNVKLLLQLRYDILTTKAEYTKTKLDLIETANRIQSKLILKPKEDKNLIKMPYNIFFYDNIKELLSEIVNETNIQFRIMNFGDSNNIIDHKWTMMGTFDCKTFNDLKNELVQIIKNNNLHYMSIRFDVYPNGNIHITYEY